MAIIKSHPCQDMHDAMRSQPLFPEALDLLKKHHNYLESLFAQCEIEMRNKNKTYLQLLPELFRAVCTHGQLEKDLVYSLARQQIYEDDDLLLLEFEESHADLNELINQLRGLGQTHAVVSFLLEELIENMRIHMEEEEATLFPDLLDLSAQQLECLAQDLQRQQYRHVGTESGS